MEEIIASRLLPFCGHKLGTIYGKRGSLYIRQKASAFQHLSTEYSGVLVLTDFRDSGEACVPAALEEYIHKRTPSLPGTFLLRFAVNEIESWLLADRIGIARYLGIALSRVPLQPEKEQFPKRTLVNLAGFSRKKQIRNGFAPPLGHHAEVGPEYLSLLQGFITNIWDIEVAMSHANSLERCVRRLRLLSENANEI